MDVIVEESGDQAMIRLPKALLKTARLRIGDVLIVEECPEGIRLAPKRPRYSLEYLITRCDPSAPPPDDLQERCGAG